jgi:hypothetical protein
MPSTWVYIASTDIVDSAGALISFNLNGIAWQGANNEKPPAKDGIGLAFSIPPGQAFDYWTFKQDADPSGISQVEFESGADISPAPTDLIDDTNTASQAAVRRLLESLQASGAEFQQLGGDVAAQNGMVANDSSLTGIIGGMSQKGYPLSFELGLSHWLKAADLTTMEEQWLVAAPHLADYEMPEKPLQEVKWVDLAETGEADSKRIPIVTFQYLPRPDITTLPIILHVSAVRVAEDQALPDFIGDATDINAAELSNWRHDFPRALGRFLDLASVKMLSTAADVIRSQERPLDFMAAMLALAHDRADMGLRAPLWIYTAEEAGETAAAVTEVRERRGKGSLAWDLILGLLLKMRGVKDSPLDVGEANDIVEKAFAKPPLLLGWPRPATAPNPPPDPPPPPDFIDLMHTVLKEMPGGSADSSKPSQSPYPALEKFLAVMIQPSAEHTKATGLDLVKAIEELHSFMNQDEALKRLFAKQWDVHFKVLGAGAPAAFRGDSAMSHRIADLDAWTQENQVSMSQAYSEGLAGSLLITHGLRLPKLPEAQPANQPPVSLEVRYAQALLIYLLNEYRVAREAGQMFKDDLPFIKSPDVPAGSDPFMTLVLPSPEQIQSVVKAGVSAAPAEGAVRDWRRTAWAKVLTGEDRASDPVTTSKPLLIPGPATGFDANRFSGVLIFGRRLPSAQWYLLSVGDLIVPPVPTQSPGLPRTSHYDDLNPDWRLADDIAKMSLGEPLKNHHVVPVPLGCARPMQLALPGSGEFFEYQGKPLGVLLWETFDQWHHRGGKAETWEARRDLNQERVKSLQLKEGDEGLKLLNRQIISGAEAYEDWGPVPGLRYDKDLKYQFLFCPMHNTGALPELLRADPAKPGLLAPRNVINARFNDDHFARHGATITNYVRKVPVGAPNMGLPLPTESSTSEMPSEDPATSAIPKSVTLRATDMRTALDGAYVRMLNQFVNSREPAARDEKALPQAPAHTVLLWKTSTSQVLSRSFRITPPSINIGEWATWMSSIPRNSPKEQENFADLIADVQRMIRELRAEIANHEAHLSNLSAPGSGEEPLPRAEKKAKQQAELEGKRKKLATLLDDPAVTRIYVRKRQLFPAYETEYTLVSRFDFPAITAPLPDDDPALNKAFDEIKREKLQLLVHTPLSKLLVLNHQPSRNPNIPRPPPNTTPPANSDRAIIEVPGGEVWEVELIPCVKMADWQNRFGLASGTSARLDLRKCPPSEALALAPEDHYGILSSVLRLWVEAAPEKPDLPSKEEVWQALRLGHIGQFSHKPPMELLEAVVLPRQEHSIKWANVSDVEFTFQKWYWRGLPENGYENLAALLREDSGVAAAAKLGERDKNEAIIRILRKAEAPGWAERPPADSERRESTVNYAAWHLAKKVDPGSVPDDPPAIEIYFDSSGAQPAEPQHILARLKVWSRYRGIGGDHDKPVEGSLNLTTPPLQEPREEHHRRITFRGLLRDVLQVPRIKLVLPLMDWLDTPDPDAATGSRRALRPGFLAIVRGALPSPFHRLNASVAWEKVDTVNADGVEKSKTLLAIGGDPITAPAGLDWAFRDFTQTLLDAELDGSACGLTYEREAGKPLFVNSAFTFPAPIELAYPGATAKNNKYDPTLRRDDWFVRVNFRWQIAPAYTMDPSARSLVSEATSWQLRLLAPMDIQDLWRRPDRKALESVTGVSFTLEKLETDAPVILFKAGMSDGSEVTVEPQPQAYPVNAAEPDRSPVTAYLFATWSLVPDLLGAEPSKASHALFLYWDRLDITGALAPEAPLKIYVAPHALPKNSDAPGAKKIQPHGANMLRIFTQKRSLEELVKGINEAHVNGVVPLDVLMDWLFPDAKTDITDPKRIWTDAKGTIVRCSEPILYREGGS